MKRKCAAKRTAPATRAKTGRPLHAPTDDDRERVIRLVGSGFTREAIALVLNISIMTLIRHYRAELDRGDAAAGAAVCDALFRKCMAGDATCIIWYLKCRRGWHDTTRTEITGADGGPVQVQRAPGIWLPPLNTDATPETSALEMRSDDTTGRRLGS